MQIASLFARIGLQTDEEKAKSFTRSLNVAKGALITIGATVAATSAAIIKISTDALDAAAAFKQFEAETGASAQELQRWQAVAEQTNSSAEAVSSAIRAITANQEKIRLGQGNISGFQLLGIDPRQDPFQILDQLRERTDGLSEAMRRNILSQLGVGAGLLQTLELSNEEFDALASRAFIIPQSAINTLADTRASLNQAGRAIDFLKTQIAVGLSPQIKELTDSFIAFIQQNQQGIIEGFQKAFEIITRFGRAIGRAASLINNLVRSTIGWENAIKGVIAVVAILNAGLLASPIGLITAGIILLIALLEDLYVFSQGGKSLFGVLLENFPALGDAIDGALSGISNVIETIRAVLGGNLSIQEAVDEWGLLGGAVAIVRDALGNIVGFSFAAIQTAWQVIAGAFGVIQDVIQSDAWGGFVNFLRDIPILGDLINLVAPREEGRLRRGIGDESALRTRAETLIQENRGATTMNNTFNIDGSQSPQDTADRINQELGRQFNATTGQQLNIE